MAALTNQKEAALYKSLKDGFVECTACEQRCKIAEGKRGLCGVRKNMRGRLYLLVYSSAAAMNNDPIEKKPLFHFLPGTTTMSIGTVGCNFKCLFCQNWDISQAPKGEEGEQKINGIAITPEQIIEKALKLGSKSISYTYNEPAIFAEFTHDIAVLARKAGLENIYVTNGYETPEALEYMQGLIDAMNIDLKSFSEEFYAKNCGARLQPVLDTIKRAYESGIWVEITTLIIPTKNDSEEELQKIAEFIFSADGKGNIPWHISRFFPLYKMNGLQPTQFNTLKKAYEIGKKAGLKYVYIGNIDTERHMQTACPKCGKIIVERNYMSLKKMDIKNGKCGFCGEKISGVWEQN